MRLLLGLSDRLRTLKVSSYNSADLRVHKCDLTLSFYLHSVARDLIINPFNAGLESAQTFIQGALNPDVGVQVRELAAMLF